MRRHDGVPDLSRQGEGKAVGHDEVGHGNLVAGVRHAVHRTSRPMPASLYGDGPVQVLVRVLGHGLAHMDGGADRVGPLRPVLEYGLAVVVGAHLECDL